MEQELASTKPGAIQFRIFWPVTGKHTETLSHSLTRPPPLPSPVGQTPGTIIRWFDASPGKAVPQRDGSLETSRDSASAYALQAKADNTRKAYRSGVRAWCA